jgi:hypothetical protein
VVLTTVEALAGISVVEVQVAIVLPTILKLLVVVVQVKRLFLRLLVMLN